MRKERVRNSYLAFLAFSGIFYISICHCFSQVSQSCRFDAFNSAMSF